MASNNIKYKILSLVAMAFLSVGFSHASVEDDESYSSMDRFSINTYCKIASLPFLWFDNYKCAKVEPLFDVKIFKNTPESKAFNAENVSEIKSKKELLAPIKFIAPDLEDRDKTSLFATTTLHTGNAKNIISANGSWSIDEWGRIVAKEIVVKKLCLDDLCIDKKTLQLILNSNRPASTTAKSI